MKNEGRGGGGGACHDWGVTLEALCMWGRDSSENGNSWLLQKHTHGRDVERERKKEEEKVKTNNWGGYLRKRIISTCSDDLQGSAVWNASFCLLSSLHCFISSPESYRVANQESNNSFLVLFVYLEEVQCIPPFFFVLNFLLVLKTN